MVPTVEVTIIIAPTYDDSRVKIALWNEPLGYILQVELSCPHMEIPSIFFDRSCVCVIYIYIYIYNMYIYVGMYVYIYICFCGYVCVCVCVCIYIYIYICT